MNKRLLTRRGHAKPARPFMIGAVDTETEGLNGELVLAQAFHETWIDWAGKATAQIYENARALVHHIFSLDRKLLRKTVWYAHNSEYDWRYFIEAFEEYG